MMVITDTWLKANHGRPRAKVEEAGDRDGLGVRVSAKGKVVFQMRYRYGDKPCRLDLGSYPKMALKAAREENARLRGRLEQGHDPRVLRRVEKKAIHATQADTLEVLFMDWYEKYAVKAKPAHREILRTFQIHVFPEFGTLPAEEVTLHHWLELLERVAVTVPSIADRVLTNAKQMLKWGVKRKRLESNPLSEITSRQDLQIKKGIGKRSLNDEELRQVWHAMDRSHVRPANKLYLKLCLAYGCRHTELRKAHKEHFDLEKKVWTVPPEHHKTGMKTEKPLLRPITPEIEPLIREALEWCGESEFLFPARGSMEARSSQTHICLPINLTHWLKRKAGYGIAPWTIKALRKTARTNFSTLTQPHIAEIMLGHKLPGSWEVYDHYDYLKEQAEAYSCWCQRIMRLAGTDSLLGADQWPPLATFRTRSIPAPPVSPRRRPTALAESAFARVAPNPPLVAHPTD